MINLEDWNPNASFIIFDDFEWQFFPCKKQFIGCQKVFTLTDKYKKKKTVTWGKPAIILTNDNVFNYIHNSLDWYNNNLQTIELINPLF